MRINSFYSTSKLIHTTKNKGETKDETIKKYKKMLEILAGVHTHTHTNSFTRKNNRDILKKDSLQT